MYLVIAEYCSHACVKCATTVQVLEEFLPRH